MYLNIFLFAGMENDVSDLYTRERERVYFQFAKLSRHTGTCHEIISNLRVTALTLNTFVQTLISLAHAHAANKNIISCILTQHNQHNTDNGIKQICDRASNEKKYDKKRIFYPSCHM